MKHLVATVALALALVGCGAPSEPTDAPEPNGFIQAYLSWGEPATDLNLHLVDTSRGGTLGDPVLDCWVGNGHPDWGHQGDITDDPIIAEIYDDPTRETLSYRIPIDGEFAIYVASAEGASEAVNLRIDLEPGEDNDAYEGTLIVLDGQALHAADVSWPQRVLTVPSPL